MTPNDSEKPRIQAHSLLGVLKFLRRYRRGALVAVGLLLINIAIVLYMAKLRMEAVRRRQRRESLVEAVKDSFTE